MNNVINIPQLRLGVFLYRAKPCFTGCLSKEVWYGLTIAKRLLIVLSVHLLYFLNIASIFNFYDICSSTLYVISLCVIHFKCLLFDVSFSSFQTANLFYFFAFLASLKLSRNHATITWFSTYKNRYLFYAGVGFLY